MIRILIADDHAIVRAGVRQFIADESDMVVAGEAKDGTEVIEMVHSGTWDVLLLDISMPGQNGVDTLKRLKHLKPELPVLILSGFSESQYAVNMMRAGASGYLNKEGAASDLVTAVRTVVKGNKYVSAKLAQMLANDLFAGRNEQPLHETLAEREFQVFCKLASGVSVSKIAEALNLSVKTISTYRTRVLEKMSMKTNADLTQYAIRNRLIE